MTPFQTLLFLVSFPVLKSSSQVFCKIALFWDLSVLLCCCFLVPISRWIIHFREESSRCKTDSVAPTNMMLPCLPSWVSICLVSQKQISSFPPFPIKCSLQGSLHSEPTFKKCEIMLHLFKYLHKLFGVHMHTRFFFLFWLVWFWNSFILIKITKPVQIFM